ncbi:MAG TPA: hypothetical protein VFL83_01700 [Anaeromyxobacter sp.]|nr:hypothetical protein [Anaeromyxobacter sp.]
MRAPSRTALHLAALAAGAVLGACGSGLYDASGVPVLEDGNGDTCGAEQITCGGVCTTPSASQCGAACQDCTASVGVPANAVAACLGVGTAGTCGYTCTGGYLKCADGCCGATALAAGDRFTCALLERTGEVACWGANDTGQLGLGSTLAQPEPARLALGAPAIAIGAGVSHACAVLQGGAVRCWGANAQGQVTGGAGVPALAPASSPVTAGATAVAAGLGHTCALLDTGAVQCWGANDLGQRGPGPGQPIPSGATALAAGRNHACALVGDQVRCWGANGSGQLGATPDGSGIAVAIPSGIRHLAAGGDHTCASTGNSTGQPLDDALRCWGDSVGTGWRLAAPQLTPAIPMKSETDSTIRDRVPMLAVGPQFVCVSNKGESVECLGANGSGQLGGDIAGRIGETVVVPLPRTIPAARALAAGSTHACAALGPADDGRLRCWGDNDAGQLGDGTTVDPGLGILVTPLGR